MSGRRPAGTHVEVCLDVPRPAAGDSRSAGACLRPGGLELTDRMLELVAPAPGAAALDIGCGSGATVGHLADRHRLRVIGIDASPAQIERARRARPDLDFVIGRAGSLPFADHAFDVILAECVLSTLDDAGAALAEMARTLKPGGRVLLSDLFSRGRGDAPQKGGLPSLGPQKTVEGLLAGAGLQVELWEDQTGALARLLWDLAGAGGTSLADAELGASSSRRSVQRSTDCRRLLGYFICIARGAGEGHAAVAKGARNG